MWKNKDKRRKSLVILGFFAMILYWSSCRNLLYLQGSPPPTTTKTPLTTTTAATTTTPTIPTCTHFHGQVSVLIKTMGRSEMVIKQIKSIKRWYPGKFTILIGDDGKVNESNLYQSNGILQPNQVRYFWFGYDFGVSESRNRLVNLTETKYIINMDDDMFWTKETKVDNLFDVFCKTQADIITMSLDQYWRSTYQGELFVDNGTNIFCQHPPGPPPFVPTECDSKNAHTFRQRILLDADYQCYQTDIGYTMYLSTREFLLANPWKGLIGTEHIDWLWAMKNRSNPAKVVGCAKIKVQHKYSYKKVWNGYNSLRMRAYKKGLAYKWKYLKETDDKCCWLSRHSRLYRDEI